MNIIETFCQCDWFISPTQSVTGSVFCVQFDSEEALVVTGGEDDLAYVWRAANGEVVFKCTGKNTYKPHIIM